MQLFFYNLTKTNSPPYYTFILKGWIDSVSDDNTINLKIKCPEQQDKKTGRQPSRLLFRLFPNLCFKYPL